MKNKFFMVATALIAMMATSCTKEIENPQQLEEIKHIPITIKANYDGDNTKVSYSESGNTISAVWESDDEILIAYDGRVSTLTISSGAGTASAIFSGEISCTHTPVDGSILNCYVKDKNSSALSISGTDIVYTNADFLDQNGTLAKAGRCNTYFGMAKYSTAGEIACTFSVNTSMLKLKICGTDDLAYGGSPATLTYRSGTNVIAVASITVYKTAQDYYIAVPAGSFSESQTLGLKIGDNDEIVRVLGNHANFAVGQTYSKQIFFGSVNLSYLKTDFLLQDGDVVTGSLSEAHKITIADGAEITLSGVSINKSTSLTGNYAGLTCLGDATIILKDGTTNNVKRFSNNSYPGIQVGPTGKKLTIKGTGTLNATGCSGIGSSNQACGNIEILNGTVKAEGETGAGIGCGSANCGNITISGGSITANGGNGATAIGSNVGMQCGNISIMGGTIVARESPYAYAHGVGIGSAPGQSGKNSVCGDISISGGTVTVRGNGSSVAIGSAYTTSGKSTCGTITITNTNALNLSATKGNGTTSPLRTIGKSTDNTYTECGEITIGGTQYYDGSGNSDTDYPNNGKTYLNTSPFTYPSAK